MAISDALLFEAPVLQVVLSFNFSFWDP